MDQEEIRESEYMSTEEILKQIEKQVFASSEIGITLAKTDELLKSADCILEVSSKFIDKLDKVEKVFDTYNEDISGEKKKTSIPYK